MTVMVLADGILGQMMEPITFKNYTTPDDLPPKDWALTGAKDRPQNIVRSLWLQEGVLENLNYKLRDKYEKIEKTQTRCAEYDLEDAEIVLVAYGVSARIVRSAVDKARKAGVKAGWIRPITLWPFPYENIKNAARGKRPPLVVEMSMGQMIEDVKLAIEGAAPVHFYGRPGGGVPTVQQVFEKIQQVVGKKAIL
jgi:2-oxoglutarate ferredoxin oxidoreductase subunit alpha